MWTKAEILAQIDFTKGGGSNKVLVPPDPLEAFLPILVMTGIIGLILVFILLPKARRKKAGGGGGRRLIRRRR